MNDNRLVEIVPHSRQLAHQQLEFYAFVHFTVNTFTDREWGDGTESPQIFNPERLDAEQWVRAVKSAGMRGLILTCKHHDGFCLWQTKHTKHSVASSPYKNGKGDVVKEVSDACRKYGIKFGVYLSPWDRNSPLYGKGREYDDYFVAQLEELLTGYGEIFSVWFDGACGEGQNGKKQYYDWERYYQTIRRLQPCACISVCGPDVRWCGNEAGHTRDAEWSVVPKRTADTEKIASASQQQDDTQFRQRKISAWDSDLGSRAILENEPELIWYPAEVNTSIRPGWFWHESENDKVRPLGELIHIYNNSVGGNATFLLNIPPTSEGLFHENDCKRLSQIGEYLRKTYSSNILPLAVLSADSEKCGCEISNVISEGYDCFYMGEADSTSARITIRWDSAYELNAIVLMENITLSQRVEGFTVEAGNNGIYQQIYSGTVIGYKRIISLDSITADSLRISITDCRKEPALSFIGVYSE